MCHDIEVNAIDEAPWNELVAKFGDASLYQTWPYEAVRSGEANVGHLVVRDPTGIVAAAQTRLIQIPYVKLGVAYVRWGPLSRLDGRESQLDRFQRAVRALRAEYVDRRGFSLRILPRMYNEANDSVRPVLEKEGYIWRPAIRASSTILLDLRPDLQELYRGLHHKWRYHLNKARKQQLTTVEGEDDASFEHFGRIYAEMVQRKRFVDFVDLAKLKNIQRRLPPELKMRVFLCLVNGEPCAGGVCSGLGDTAIYLFGATSNRGIKNYSSYLVHWNMVVWAKSLGCQTYDLNGIDPVRNSGGYQFKSQLAASHGREVTFVGTYDAYPSSAVRNLIAVGDLARQRIRRARQVLAQFS